ncbi:hypothetical protein N3K66_001487 [Trichothecium roseum]|uniref:Uncharacterized protein n=1 Tax=Trichothecium roseum TaxID=47278 RepID=A0ACC0VHM8_9HYPO|nr:hypothetical protein N3K66_001487 [Trichothecium roseum]
MTGDADFPQRSSSPLKRRASSMEQDEPTSNSAAEGSSQLSNGLPRAMSVDPPEGSTAPTGSSQSNDHPPIQEQIKTIETLLRAAKETPVKEGDKAYLVSRSWVDKALSLRSDKKQPTSPADVGTLGPVDNSDIIDRVIKDSSGQEAVILKSGLGQESFELFPEDAWNLISEWYGLQAGQQPIVRTAINAVTDGDAEAMYEFHPVILRVHRLWSEISPIPIEQTVKATDPPCLIFVRSRGAHAHTFLKEVKQKAGIPLDRKVRLVAFMPQQPAHTPDQNRSALTPPDSPRISDENLRPEDWTRLLIDLPTYAKFSKDKIMTTLPDTTMNEKYNGKSSLSMFDLVTDQTLVLDEKFEDFWVSTYTGQNRKPGKLARSAGSVRSPTASGRSSPAPSGPLTRGRGPRTKFGKSLGAVGLQNLGNTCYMNSALQCVRSVEELTKYFLTDSYAEELNKSNALGYNGKVALAYMNLLKEIYREGRGSVNPRDFKTTVGRARTTFQGWGQQDSQEFLGFLLDALQEDLSRIKKKPYIEKPDSTDEMINDPEAIRKMADEVWDITRKRDDSVIADLFTGMYKSTLKCPVCDKISITFDPFNNLTLPLPVENLCQRKVKFFPLNDAPVLLEIELSKHSAIEQLKQFVAARTGVPMERLMGAEEFKDRFFKIYDNNHDVEEEIQANDVATLHELEAVPTNFPGKAKQKKYRSMLDIATPPDAEEWDDPQYERMVIPVFHRRPHGGTAVSPPHFIIVTRDQASSLDQIRRKVLEKVATFSTWSGFRDGDKSDNTDNTDSDVAVMNASDADSGDSKVAAQSVEGEEDMVDVSMQDASDRSSVPPVAIPGQPQILKKFNTKRPSFIEPGSFLSPELQNLFELSYFTDSSDGPIPTGWSAIDGHRAFPKLSDRLPQESEEDDGQASPKSWGSTASGNEESSNDEAQKDGSSQTRMNEESSGEEIAPPRFQQHKPMSNKQRKRLEKQAKRGGKKMKGNNKLRKEVRRAQAVKPQPTPPAVADGGPLVRLGEGIIVDWNDDAWETLFGKSAMFGEPSHGSKTFSHPETLNDTALKITQRRRKNRRTRGITLEECLDEFERAEILSEQDMWYCPRCKEHRRASKKFDLWKTPDILVAHLKRFSSSGYRRDKLDVLVDFPITDLDLTERVIQKEDGQVEIYDLIAVDDHYGGLGGGHYTAYAKNFLDGVWYNFNDSSVSTVSDPSTVVTSAAYLLFYRRRSSQPLGGPRFAEIYRKFDKPEDSDEDTATESGDDRRHGGISSRTGGAASHQPLGQTQSRTTVTPLDGPDDEEPDLPPYESTLRPSVEDEGVEMNDGWQPAGPISMTQAWSFNNLGDEDLAGDAASDEAQLNSSDDERGQSRESSVEDIDMTMPSPDEKPDDASAEATKTIHNVPAAASGTKQGSDDVTEIHVEGEPGSSRLD